MNKDMTKLAAGILIGGLIVVGIWALINKEEGNSVLSGSTTSIKKNNSEDLFAKKDRCVAYTEKRLIEANNTGLSGTTTSVEGFYSKIADTCMTNSTEIAQGYYIQSTLTDEMTGRKEAFAFKSIGKELDSLSLESKQFQIKQDYEYQERLKYFRGE